VTRPAPEGANPLNLWDNSHHIYVNESLWDLEWYPVYCAGPCTITSSVTAKALFETASRTNWRGFPIEDVLFTGIIRKKANLPKESV
jgi:hypothetical protein